MTVELSGITSRIFIEASIETTEGKAVVTIRDTHTNVSKIVVNGEIILETDAERAAESAETETEVHRDGSVF